MSENENEKKITRMKDRPEKVDSPLESIRKFCLYICETKGRKGSIKDMIYCTEIKCPLFPYRTGKLKARKGSYSPNRKRASIVKLETARKMVTNAETRVARHEKTVEDRKKRNEELLAKSMEGLNQALQHLEECKSKVRDIELQFNDELSRGLWGTDKSLEDVILEMKGEGEQKE